MSTKSLYSQKRSNRNINAIIPPKQSVYAKSDLLNHHNFPAFSRSLEEQYVQLLLTNTLGGTYYCSKNELVDGTHELNRKMLAKDTEFMGKALMYARNEGFMRLQPIIGLVYLSTSDELTYREFEFIFNKVILTPGDLQDFVEIVRKGNIRKGLGRRIKSAVNQWLIGISEYHVIKYGSENAAFSLRDILRLTRPDVNDFLHSTQNEYRVVQAKFSYLLRKDAVDYTLIPQIATFEALKKAKDEKEIIALVEAGKLPHEVVTGVISPTKKVWQAIQKQMPTFALIRNLRTLHRHDALDVAYFAKRISVEAIQNARIDPWRVYVAYRECKDLGIHNTALGALSLALDNCAGSLPELPNNTVIALDVSDSMNRAKITENSTVTALEVGAVLVGIASRMGNTPELLCFDTKTRRINVVPNTPVLITVDKLAAIKGGGTNLADPIEYIYGNNINCDVFIGVTDSEDWAGHGFLRAWEEFRSRRNKNAKAYLIQLAPNRGLSAPNTNESIRYVYGWSSEVLKFIAFDNQISYIKESIEEAF